MITMYNASAEQYLDEFTCEDIGLNSLAVDDTLLNMWRFQIPQWKAHGYKVKQLERIFEFTSYMNALEFINSVALLADVEQHHPTIQIGKFKLSYLVTITWFTPDVNGISMNDLIMAAKTDCAYI